MQGTIYSVIFEIDRIPPRMTRMTRMVITSPLFSCGMSKLSASARVMEFDCAIFPMPKEESTANSANSIPRMLPAFLFGNALCSVYIGPPVTVPASFFARYFTASMLSANFVESPIRAERIIHMRAPGPPMTIAVATPTIFPVPMVAASSVVRDASAEISPSCPLPSSF